MVFLTRKKINPQKLIRLVQSPQYGGVVLFLGEVRNISGHSSRRHRSKSVVSLEYSAYEAMAIKKMEQIRRIVLKKWKERGVGKAAVIHRLGKLKVEELSVAAAVSAVHRKEAFEACRFLIGRIKKTVPIFKKEFFSNGRSSWVGC